MQVENLLSFGRCLKDAGIGVGVGQLIDAGRALERVDIGCRPDFYTALRSNLISRKEDIPLFDRVFDSFWTGLRPDPAPAAPFEESIRQFSLSDATLMNIEDASEQGSSGSWAYSPIEILRKKDFNELSIEESREMRRAILAIARRIATRVSRRRKRDDSADALDLRRTMRKSLSYGGDVVEFARRRRKIKKTRIVLLCDVSGSMESYSRFLIQFMYGLQNELWGVETFVFSTSLMRITHLIRSKNIEGALERLSSLVSGWSGGTNIGRCFSTFNHDFAGDLVDHRTFIIVISDGWDCGDVDLLAQEMKKMKRRCRKVVWLNPLLASKDYEPLCKGMQAVLPHLDDFLPAHNLESLMALTRTLAPSSGEQNPVTFR
jgi:uncharacterized protein with von Willebrand factor type A (vWA) domain